ncbi:MAG TPA: M20/M25/M40 family metallo-hydrolase [Bryobacteraceae bacterium]|nr:M20/M25/M40 family metallo-hydrolase [Bryobacteraceae bacterium]
MPRTFLSFSVALLLAAPVFAQDLPDAPGKDVTLRICTGCHGAEMWASERRSQVDWDQTISAMTEKGLTISDTDYTTVLDYLSKNLGKAKPQPAPAPAPPPAAAPAPAASSPVPEAREILKQLIEINTTNSVGDNTKAAEAMAARFRDAGFPAEDVQVVTPMPRKGDLVVRLRGTGTGGKPVLFIGHLDVVEAARSDWSMDPFTLIEKDGFFYGRGVTDMKGDDALVVEAFLRLKREGFRPARDLILALTSDEETGPANGVQYLVKEHRDLIDSAFAINFDAGGGDIRNGKRLYFAMQAAEKMYESYKLEVTNPGGHSSRPTKDNAIYRLAAGLTRFAKYDFPVQLFDVTKQQLERSAPYYGGQQGADMKAIAANPKDAAAVARFSELPQNNALLRTTCTPTLISGGHAENALPQLVTATINCRILPVDNAPEVEKKLTELLADPQIKVTPVKGVTTVPYTPIDPKVMSAVSAVTEKHWPGLPVIPKMSLGATDGIYLIRAGIPAYGVSGIFRDEDDDRAHGRDERILTQSFDDGVAFIYDLVTALGKN